VKYKLFTNDKMKRIIDINVFRLEKNHAWCIQPFEDYDDLGAISRYILSKIIFLYKKYSVSSYYDKFPYKHMLNFGCWWVPNKYYNNIQCVCINNYKINIPSKVEEYLDFRYKAWTKINKNWNFKNDDGALLQTIPKDVAKTIFSTKY